MRGRRGVAIARGREARGSDPSYIYVGEKRGRGAKFVMKYYCMHLGGDCGLLLV